MKSAPSSSAPCPTSRSSATSPRPLPKASKLLLAAFAALAGAGFFAFAADDPVQNLIETEKKTFQEWLEEGDEPPLAYMPGSVAGVELYSPGYNDDAGSMLCAEPELNELLELTGGSPTAPETPLNLSLPRVRERLGDSCLMRPGDRVVAIGRGWQEERALDTLIIRRERPACPGDSPYALWSSFDRPLPEDPLFVTTDPAVRPGDNLFVPVDQIAVAGASAEIMARLKGIVSFPEDYRVTVLDLRRDDVEAVVMFERRDVRGEDDGLPSVAAVAVSTTGVQALWTERVDKRRGTGHFEFVGMLDFDGDGGTDLVFSGTHGGCSYTVVFRRSEGTFLLLPLPWRNCAC